MPVGDVVTNSALVLLSKLQRDYEKAGGSAPPVLTKTRTHAVD